MASRTGRRLRPRSVRVYSTRGGNLRVDGAGEQSAGLHLPQLGGEDLLGDGADGLFQLPKAFGARHQVSQDQNLPFVADQGQGGFHRTGWARG